MKVAPMKSMKAAESSTKTELKKEAGLPPTAVVSEGAPFVETEPVHFAVATDDVMIFSSTPSLSQKVAMSLDFDLCNSLQ